MSRHIATALAVALAGCWVPVERGRQMESRIERLEDENEIVTRELEEQRQVFRDRVALADAKIAEVQKKLDELNATAHRTGADVVARQDQLQQEVASLRGALEESQHRAAALDRQLAQVRQETDAKFAALRGAGALDQYEARRKIEALKRPSEPRAYLALAREQDAAGEKAVARELYEDLARRWPADPAAAQAHYRLAEIHAADGRHREAILAFGKVAKDFPRSELAPDAMLKTGDSLIALGLRDEAVGVWKELAATHPKSAAAKAAREKVTEIERAAKKSAPAPKNSSGRKR